MLKIAWLKLNILIPEILTKIKVWSWNEIKKVG
jgi:hypothetical protein